MESQAELLFCGDPMCKQAVGTTAQVTCWPVQCTSCGATVYPVDDLRAAEWSKVDTNRTVAMVERGNLRLPYPKDGRVKEPDPEPDLDSILRIVDGDRPPEREAVRSPTIDDGAQCTPAALSQVVVQVRVGAWGDRTDLDLRYSIEDEIGECLAREELGHCDGGDIGSGTINAFFYVGDTRRAVQRMIAVLRTLGLAEAATIAVRDDEGGRHVWYPPGQADFSL